MEELAKVSLLCVPPPPACTPNPPPPQGLKRIKKSDSSTLSSSSSSSSKCLHIVVAESPRAARPSRLFTPPQKKCVTARAGPLGCQILCSAAVCCGGLAHWFSCWWIYTHSSSHTSSLSAREGGGVLGVLY